MNECFLVLGTRMRDILNTSQCISAALEDVILHIHAVQYVTVDKADSRSRLCLSCASSLGLLHSLFRHIGGRNVKDRFPAWTILHLGFVQALGGFFSDMVRLLLGRVPEGGFLLLVSAEDLWERHGCCYKILVSFRLFEGNVLQV